VKRAANHIGHTKKVLHAARSASVKSKSHMENMLKRAKAAKAAYGKASDAHRAAKAAHDALMKN